MLGMGMTLTPADFKSLAGTAGVVLVGCNFDHAAECTAS